MSSQVEVIAELRMRVIRFIARHGETTFPGGPHGEKVRLATLGDLRFELRSSRHLKVGFNHESYDGMGKVIYDSDRSSEYQDAHVAKLVVLPRLRKEMVLDDLSTV